MCKLKRFKKKNHIIIKTKKKCYHKMLQGFQNSLKSEIGLTVHELRDLRNLLNYVNHVTHEPLV